MSDEKVPHSKEHKGRWIGISHNVGDKLTFHIYCEDTGRIVSCIVICTADPKRGEITNQQLALTPFLTHDIDFESDTSNQNKTDFEHKLTKTSF